MFYHHTIKFILEADVFKSPKPISERGRFIYLFELVSLEKTLHSVLIIINENQELDNKGLAHSSLEKQWLL